MGLQYCTGSTFGAVIVCVSNDCLCSCPQEPLRECIWQGDQGIRFYAFWVRLSLNMAWKCWVLPYSLPFTLLFNLAPLIAKGKIISWESHCELMATKLRCLNAKSFRMFAFFGHKAGKISSPCACKKQIVVWQRQKDTRGGNGGFTNCR